MSSPSPFDYRKILDSFKAKQLTDREIEQRLSELVLVFDFAASLNRGAGIREIAELLLLSLMGYTASRRGVFLLRNKETLETIAHRGCGRNESIPPNFELRMASPYPEYYFLEKDEDQPQDFVAYRDICAALSVDLLVPLQMEGGLIGFVGLGSPLENRKYAHHELRIIVSLVQMCASAVQNARTNQTLQLLNRQLILKVYQLNTLFDLSKDFNAVWDPEGIFRILGTSLIGQLMISRCAAFALNEDCMELRFIRGFRQSDLEVVSELNFPSILTKKLKPFECGDLASEKERAFCVKHKIQLIFPMVWDEVLKGFILLGEKKNHKPFAQEDYDFITTLANLALVADANARMQQQMIEKQRMDKELSIAREIQFSLLPQSIPKIEGYDLSTGFYPAYQVGGDYFDFIPVSDSEVAIAIGDVSGKSTPAAMIMASLQASLRALASLEVTNPKITIEKINNLLCQNHTRSNKYVTFFYGILNHQTHQFSYVNAGHCYPLVLRANGAVDRLEIGGMVMGFFKDVHYRSAIYNLEPRDLMILYTDGVSELINPAEEEFGVERIIEVLREHQNQPVDEIQKALVQSLEQHRQNQNQWDDITFILLKRI
jgi:sigma-B regulation protein RsbU (phosphoserine phosphatase)